MITTEGGPKNQGDIVLAENLVILSLDCRLKGGA